MKFKILNIFIIYRVLCKMSDFDSDSESVSVIDSGNSGEEGEESVTYIRHEILYL